GVLKEQPQDNDEKRYDLYIEGNYLNPVQREFEEIDIDQEEEEKIQELAAQEDIFDQIVDSIAPSIHGHRQVKKAIALQLFSGNRKERPDGTSTRGDIHVLLIGEPGTGKCVAPETEILDTNGKPHKIVDVVEKELEASESVEAVDDGVYTETTIETLGIDEDAQTEQKEATKVWKREAPETMYRIRTESGRELEVTPSHPLFVPSGGKIKAEKAERLREGTFIAAPRTLPTDGDDRLEATYRKSKANNAITLNPPESLNSGFGRLLGYITAEGYIQTTESNSNTLYITNDDEEIRHDIKEQLERLGVNWTERKSHKGKSAKEIHTSSSELISFLTEIEPALAAPSSEQQIPAPIMRAQEDVKQGFLKAVIDAEGTVSRNQREIVVGSTSRRLLRQIQQLLQESGIQSQLRKRPESWRLRISGNDMEYYMDEIGFVTGRKSTRGHQYESPTNTNKDVVPAVGPRLRSVRTRLGMTQHDFSISRGAYQHYERGDRNPSLSSFKTVIKDFRDRYQTLQSYKEQLKDPSWEKIQVIRQNLGVSQQEIASARGIEQTLISQYEQGAITQKNEPLQEKVAAELQQTITEMQSVKPHIDDLERLGEADIYWDRIERIEAVEPDYDYVYDLEVPAHHNYVTNGIISHNSQLLKYTGNLAPKGKYVVGKSATAAGITATAMKDEITDGWVLEAGALVLANKGLATIDEIDKMSDEDRSSMHEAMEQQCFAPDTKVELSNGTEKEIGALVNNRIARLETVEKENEKEIAELDGSLTVRSADMENGTLQTADVSVVGRRPAPQTVFLIETEDGSQLELTPEHPVFCSSEPAKTKPAEKLEKGDELPCPGDENNIKWKEIVDISTVNPDYDYVYDLTVPGTNSFIAENTVAHNSITVSKANIQATLQCRTSILAAGNPKFGRFDPYKPVGEQINISDTLLSRFDLLFPVKDVPDRSKDEKLAGHIISMHTNPEEHTGLIEQEQLRNYIAYAKRHSKPALSEAAQQQLKDFYVNTREQGGSGEDGLSKVPITARQLEALIRLAEASAKTRLSDTVEEKDAQRAIDLLTYSLKQIGVIDESGEFDIDKLETGMSSEDRSRMQIIMSIISELGGDSGDAVPVEDVLAQCEEEGLSEDEAEEIIDELKRDGEIYEPKNGHIGTI
ncbi:MAG: cell division protein, partial [Candidatus Nanohaloarchaeota archaeon QJJ-5]|nr:cell division protein [Candidatus Nanohaloarchaeota archaeon QJJ-5]